ncbi:MAG: hypothetical protein IPP71_10365 [Bacteroidetes bacterium]|nr:hypothetical protein [Bacteroidota bacterium]
MTHLINRLQFEINCPDEDRALNFRHNFSQKYQEQFTEIIDRICSKYVRENEWIQISKLQIDLGRFYNSDFSDSVPLVFETAFEESIVRVLSGISVQSRMESKLNSSCDLMQYFLLNVTLPWWGVEEDVNPDIMIIDLIKFHKTEIIQFLLKNRLNSTIWERLALQFRYEVKQLIVLQFKELVNAGEIIRAAIKEKAHADSKNPVAVFTESDDERLHDLLLFNATKIFQNPGLENSIKFVSDDNNFKIDIQNKIYKTKNEESQFAANDALLAELQPGNEEQYIIKNSGIVIFAPFLNEFFKLCNLLNGNEWKSSEDQVKAVHLLNFISTGLTESPEYSLILEKLLCNIPLNQPIHRDVQIKESDIAESEQLIQTVIEHWSALKKTSINGLRESFLKRDGILIRANERWVLKVETKTQDVLMKKIQWGFSPVRLPWNNYILDVEWI